MPDKALIHRWCSFYATGSPSPDTIRLRRYHLMRLARNVDIFGMDEEDMVDWMDQNSHLKPESRKSVSVSYRLFFQWAVARDLLPVDPTAGLPSIRTPEGIPNPITESALSLTLERSNRVQMTATLLGAYQGLRRAETAAVHSDNINGNRILVMGKGRRERWVPIHARVAPVLQGFDGWLFPSPVRIGQPVGADYISSQLEKVLPDPWTTHTLRHRYATQLFRACKDIRIVQQLMGHASVQTTMRYIQVDEDAAVQAVAMLA